MHYNLLTLKIKTFWLQLRICIKDKIDCRIYYNLISPKIVNFIYFPSQAKWIIIEDYRELYIKKPLSCEVNYKTE